MIDLLLSNGQIVTPTDTYAADIAIDAGRIVAVGQLGKLLQAKRTVDLTGKYVLPGVIEPHMHVEAPFMGCLGQLDFYTASKVAAFGGVTFFMDFSNTGVGDSVLAKVKERRDDMRHSAIDYGIHAKFVEATPRVLAEIPEIVAFGCPSFKMFMTYKKEGVMIDDEGLIQVFSAARTHGALPGVHAESNAIAELNVERMRASGDLSWTNFPLSKPNLCEKEAVDRAINLARYAGSPLYIFHLSSQEGLDSVIAAQNEGQAVIAETCPHYLVLDQSLYEGGEGYRAIMSPPLRTPADNLALWRGLASGALSAIGSDNCTYSLEEKQRFLAKDAAGRIIPDFTKVVNGVSGLEERLPLLLEYGVRQRRLTVNQVCALTSYNPAKIFGLYPQKGAIQTGSDADLVVVDLDKTEELTEDSLHYQNSYTLYGGRIIHGWPVMTIAGGRILVEDGVFYGEPGSGRYIPRKIGY